MSHNHQHETKRPSTTSNIYRSSVAFMQSNPSMNQNFNDLKDAFRATQTKEQFEQDGQEIDLASSQMFIRFVQETPINSRDSRKLNDSSQVKTPGSTKNEQISELFSGLQVRDSDQLFLQAETQNNQIDMRDQETSKKESCSSQTVSYEDSDDYNEFERQISNQIEPIPLPQKQRDSQANVFMIEDQKKSEIHLLNVDVRQSLNEKNDVEDTVTQNKKPQVTYLETSQSSLFEAAQGQPLGRNGILRQVKRSKKEKKMIKRNHNTFSVGPLTTVGGTFAIKNGFLSPLGSSAMATSPSQNNQLLSEYELKKLIAHQEFQIMKFKKQNEARSASLQEFANSALSTKHARQLRKDKKMEILNSKNSMSSAFIYDPLFNQNSKSQQNQINQKRPNERSRGRQKKMAPITNKQQDICKDTSSEQQLKVPDFSEIETEHKNLSSQIYQKLVTRSKPLVIDDDQLFSLKSQRNLNQNSSESSQARTSKSPDAHQNGEVPISKIFQRHEKVQAISKIGTQNSNHFTQPFSVNHDIQAFDHVIKKNNEALQNKDKEGFMNLTPTQARDSKKEGMQGTKKSHIQITPELAATVVKDYLLPMFNNDGRKLLKRRNKFSSFTLGPEHMSNARCLSNMSSSCNVQFNGTKGFLFQNVLEKNTKPPTTVYEELKLTMIQQNEIDSLKQTLQNQTEILEMTKQDKFQLTKQLSSAENKIIFQQNCIRMQKEQIKQLMQYHKLAEDQFKLNGIENSNIKDYLLETESKIKNLKVQLAEKNHEHDHFRTLLITKKQEDSLLTMQVELMREQLSQLYGSVKTLGDVKILQDQHKVLQDIQQKEKISLQTDLEDIKNEYTFIWENFSETRIKLQQLYKMNKKLVTERQRLHLAIKLSTTQKEEIIGKQNLKLEKLEQENGQQASSILSLEKNIHSLTTKIHKIKNRKNIDLNRKFCQNCKKEYPELENYNWSCCTHRSEWGGTMWWCCGKSKETAPGCRFRKHVSKREEDDLNSENEVQLAKRQKCYACKELGHLIEDCPRDPNFKTQKDPGEEAIRISSKVEKISESVQAHKLTEQLLGKLALLSNERIGLQMLSFDDFNYGPFNKKIFDLNVSLETFENEEIQSSEETDDLANEQEDHTKREGFSQQAFDLAEVKTPDDILNGINSIKSLTSGDQEKEDYSPNASNSKTNLMKLFHDQHKTYFKEHQQSDPFHNLVQARVRYSSNEQTKLANLIKIEEEISKLQEIRNMRTSQQILPVSRKKGQASKSPEKFGKILVETQRMKTLKKQKTQKNRNDSDSIDFSDDSVKQPPVKDVSLRNSQIQSSDRKIDPNEDHYHHFLLKKSEENSKDPKLNEPLSDTEASELCMPLKRNNQQLFKFELDLLKRKQKIMMRHDKIRNSNMQSGNVKPIDSSLEQLKGLLSLRVQECFNKEQRLKFLAGELSYGDSSERRRNESCPSISLFNIKDFNEVKEQKLNRVLKVQAVDEQKELNQRKLVSDHSIKVTGIQNRSQSTILEKNTPIKPLEEVVTQKVAIQSELTPKKGVKQKQEKTSKKIKPERPMKLNLEQSPFLRRSKTKKSK